MLINIFWPFDTVWIEGAGCSFNTFTSEDDSVSFILSASVCVFPNDKTSVCVRPQCVIMSGRLERKRRGKCGEQKVKGERRRWDREKRRGAVVFAPFRQWCSWNVPSLASQWNCSLPVCLSVLRHFFSVSSFVHFFSSLPLKQSPPLFLPQPAALCRREARPLLCSQSSLSDYCSVIASKWILD